MGTSQLPRLPLARNFGVLTKSGVWSCKNQRNNHTAKAKLYAQRQQAARKDVERAFGVLQKRWAIIRHPARLWEMEELADIMYACIILHNMIVEDERGSYDIPDDNTYEQGPFSVQTAGLHHGPIYGFADVLEKHREIRDRQTHRWLKEDLIEHIWQKYGAEQN